MCRSTYKVFINSSRLCSKKNFRPYYRSKTTRFSDYFVWSRASLITSKILDKRIAVYNGRKFITFTVRPSMLGYRFGEFSFTRKFGKVHKLEKKSSRRKSQKSKEKKKVILSDFLYKSRLEVREFKKKKRIVYGLKKT